MKRQEKPNLLANHLDHVGPGWTPVIQSLGESLGRLLEDEPEASIQVDCVKEKFGGLRVYLTYFNASPKLCEIAEDLISLAERVCSKICEECGRKAGNPPKDAPKLSWIKTLCEEHHLDREERARKAREEFARKFNEKAAASAPPVVVEEDEEEDEC